jgi:hypothetical protein
MRLTANDTNHLNIATYRFVASAAAILVSAIIVLLATANLSEAGALRWAKRAGGIDSEAGGAIAVDGSGSSYVTGYFEGSMTLGSGEANQTTLSSAGGSDLFVAKYNPTGGLTWAKRAGGTGDDETLAIEIDAAGNSYITGYFEGSATFGFGEANQTVLTSSSGGSDIFVAKYNSSGALLWAKRAGGSGSGQGFGVRVGGSGNVYLTGSFEGSITFGFGEANQTSLTADGAFDMFVARYNANGTFAWAKRAGGAGDDEGFGITLDGNTGTSYVTGYFEGSATFGSGEANQTALTSTGSNDMFVAKYNSNGSLAWAKRAGGTGFVDGIGIARDGASNLYATGTFSGAATFGSGEVNQTVLTAGSGFESFVAKYTSAGALVWAKQTSGTGFIEGFGIAVDAAGNSYVTGYFDGSATFGPAEPGSVALTSAGGFDLFVAKYNSNGSLAWAKQAGGTGFDVGSAIALDASGNSYTTGYFDGSATFGKGEGKQTVLTSTGGYDLFVAKYAANTTACDAATGNAFFVCQQYLDFLDREPDAGGLTAWVNALNGGLPRATMIQIFMDSGEFFFKGKFIARLYLGLLGRDADHAGFRGWLEVLRAGISREQIVQGFLNSGEFESKFGSNLTNAQFVHMLYVNVLRRSADTGGLNFWVGQLNSAQMTRAQVAVSFLDSVEFQNLSANRVNVSLLYFDMLRRDPDPSGFSAWVGALNSGLPLVTAIDIFVNSGEYSSRF